MTPEYNVPMGHLLNKVKSLEPYSTAQEKNALLAADDLSNMEMLGILSPVKASSEAEAVYLLLKLREISVSDVLEGMIECSECQTLNEFQIELNEDIDLDESIPIGVFESTDEIANTDTMNILDINKLEEKVQSNNKLLLNLMRTVPCRVCKNEIEVIISPRSILSNSNLSNIFQEYFLFGKFLHYSNRDVDYLKPYERSILFKILKKDVETSAQMPNL